MLADLLTNNILNSLNSNEQFILQYIYSNQKKVSNSTIRELANQLNTSTTSILRFCKKIELQGFSELKFHLKDTIQNKQQQSFTPRDEHTIISEISDDIENTLLLIKEYDINQMITILDNTKNIHLFSGGGISASTIDYLEKMLFSYGRQNTYRYESSRLAFQIAENLNKNDILFLISASGTYEPTVKMANLAKISGAQIVAITPYTDNLLATIADINFRFFVRPKKNRNTEYTSRLPIFFIIDTIFKTYLNSKED